MSKICPGCQREIDDNIKFCPFCSAFAGEESGEEKGRKGKKNIIIAGFALLALIAVILAVFVFDVFGFFGHENKNRDTEQKGTGAKLFSMGLVPVKIGGAYGYADEQGEVVIAPEFISAGPFAENSNGYAAVGDGSYRYINEKGESVISADFDTSTAFSDKGTAVVSSIENGYHLIDSYGRNMFDSGFAYISNITDNGYAYAYGNSPLPENVDVKLQPQKYTYYILKTDGTIPVTLYDTGISDISGDLFTGYIHPDVTDTKRVFAVYSCADGKKLTDNYDRIYYSNDYILLCTNCENGMYSVKITDRSFDVLSEEFYTDDNFESFDSGFILYKKNGDEYRKVLVDDSFNVIATESDTVKIISGFDKSGIACIKENDRYCSYTVDGKGFESENPFGTFNCGLAPFVEKSGRVGYINTNGNIVIPAKYLGATEFSADGYAFVQHDINNYSLIKLDGTSVIDNLYADTTRQSCYRNDFSSYDYHSFYDGDYLVYDDILTVQYDKSLELSDKEKGEISSDIPWCFSDKDEVKLYNFVKTDGKDVRIFNYEYYYAITGFDSSGDAYVINKDVRASVDRFYPYIPDDLYFVPKFSINENVYKNDIVFSTKDGYTSFCTSDGKNSYISDSRFYCVMTGLETLNPLLSCDGSIAENGDRPFIIGKDLVPSLYLWDSCEIIGLYGNTAIISNKLLSDEKLYLINSYTGETIFSTKNNIQFLENGTITETISERIGNGEAETLYTYYNNNGVMLYEKSGYENKNLNTAHILLKDEKGYFFVDSFGRKSGYYKHAEPYSKSGYAVVYDGNDYICIDESYNEIFRTKYDTKPPVNGYAPYFDKDTGMVGYLDMKGEIALPAKYECVGDFYADNYAVIKSAERGAYVIDKEGNEVLDKDAFSGKYINDFYGNEHSYSAMTFISYADYILQSGKDAGNGLFRFGFMPYAKGKEHMNEAYQDKYGNTFFTDKEFIETSHFQRLDDNIIAIVSKRTGGLYGVMDIKGNMVTDCIYDSVRISRFGHIICSFRGMGGSRLYSAEGEIQLEGTAIIDAPDGYRVYDKRNFIVRFYDKELNLTDTVWGDDYMAGLEGSDETLPQPADSFDYLNEYYNGYKVSGVVIPDENVAKYGFIDENGEEVTGNKYTSVSSFFDDGYSIVIIDNLKGYIIDRNGNIINTHSLSGYEMKNRNVAFYVITPQ